MRRYQPDQILSFKCADKLTKDAKLTRTYERRGKKYTDEYWIEFTDNAHVIVIPQAIVQDLKDNSPHGFRGTIKQGHYTIELKSVTLSNPHCVYNGVAYCNVEYTHKGEQNAIHK